MTMVPTKRKSIELSEPPENKYIKWFFDVIKSRVKINGVNKSINYNFLSCFFSINLSGVEATVDSATWTLWQNYGIYRNFHFFAFW